MFHTTEPGGPLTETSSQPQLLPNHNLLVHSESTPTQLNGEFNLIQLVPLSLE
jgi:hypothetical protein